MVVLTISSSPVPVMQVVVTVALFCLEIASIILNLNAAKIYNKYSRNKNPEIIKWFVGVFSSIGTFLFNTLLALITMEVSSRWFGWLQFIVAILVASVQLFKNCKEITKIEPKYKSYDGVFAVSAIIITKAKRILLVTRKQNNEAKENLWVQPGVYYRTNTLHKNPQDLEPFYNHLIESIESECGLTKNVYQPLQLNSIILEKQDVFAGSGLTTWNANFTKNKFSQTPFLIEVEEAEVKSRSDTKRHVDCFYAFELTIDDDEKLLSKVREATAPNAKYEKLSTFTYDEVEKMSREDGLYKDQTINRCYSDLTIVLKKFLELWRKEIFLQKYKNNIRHCTFNADNHTIWMHINDTCNLGCEFCLMQNRVKNTTIISHNLNQFHKFWDNIIFFDDPTEYHLVVTGGEPFLVKDLYEMIAYMDSHSNGRIKSISICTNGTLGTTGSGKGYKFRAKENLQNLMSQECNFKSKLKFVINMSSFDERSLNKIANAKQGQYNEQCEFIKCLHDNNVHNIVANVVMTDVFEKNLDKYFVAWEKLGIYDIALSYAIQLGITSRGGLTHIRTLSKDECIKVYYSLGNGQFPIEKLNNIELMIPSCDEKDRCKENMSILSCFMDAKEWKMQRGCINI